jgi:DNA-binding NarL/FixJ family response regulator
MRSVTPTLTSQIVAMYQSGLGATLDDSEQFIPYLTRAIRGIIDILGVVLVAEPDRTDGSFRDRIETVEQLRTGLDSSEPMTSTTRTGWINSADGRDILDIVMERGMEGIARAMSERFPDYIAIHHHWIRIDHSPRIAVCLFRPGLPDGTGRPFSDEEIDLIEALAPHITSCVRIHMDIVRARRTGFDFFAERCHLLATTHHLTFTEFRVLRLLIEGSSNNEIAVEVGSTPATVKTHITHILQKTGCRNRSDLIGKYFSSKNTIKF